MDRVFQTGVPRTVFINGIEVPSYQTFWREKMELLTEIDKLKSGQRMMACLLIIQGIAVILAVATQLC